MTQHSYQFCSVDWENLLLLKCLEITILSVFVGRRDGVAVLKARDLLNVFILQLISWTRFCHSINYWPSHRGHKHTHCRVCTLLILEENTKISSDLFGPKTHANTWKQTHNTVECVHTVDVESKHTAEKWSIWSTQSPVCTRSGYHRSWAIFQTFWFN